MEKAEWQKARYNNGNVTWSTPKEKDFINTMGSHRYQLHPVTDEQYKKRHLNLLIGFQKGIERRKNWGTSIPL